MASKSHIEIARTNGPKAGLRAYEQALRTSGLPSVLERAVEVFSMPSKERFRWYCAQFGSQFGTTEDTHDSQADEVARLRARLAELTGESTPAPTRKARTPKQAPAKVAPAQERPVAKRITFPMAMVLKRHATRTGGTFEFTGKLGKNSYAVKVNGRNLTPAQASALIAQIKGA